MESPETGTSLLWTPPNAARYPQLKWVPRDTIQPCDLRQKQENRMSQPEITIYTKFGCGFCYRAKRLLDEKGAEYTEHDITMGGPKRDEMLERAPLARTVPQIFIGAVHVGGSDELHALEREGKLDALLAG